MKIENDIIGCLILRDTIKVEAKDAIQKLNSLNIKTMMFTGDNLEVAKNVAKEIGISSIPTMIFAPIGQDPQILMGAKSKEELKKYIDEILLGKQE